MGADLVEHQADYPDALARDLPQGGPPRERLPVSTAYEGRSDPYFVDSSAIRAQLEHRRKALMEQVQRWATQVQIGRAHV